jgi:hypothetical protein
MALPNTRYFNFLMKQEVFKFCCHVEIGARESSINFKKKVDALFIYLFFNWAWGCYGFLH